MIKTYQKYGLIGLSVLFLCFPLLSNARDIITDWYIKDFQADFTLNKDSTLLVTEKIIADCDNLPDKHGIFKVMPLQMNINGNIVDTPIKLLSITDFNDNPLKYSTIKNNTDHTITYKIGDANKTVTGENYFKITYLVKNVIRFSNENFDEFYWNLVGNFWDMDIDNFNGKVFFPEEITEDNTQIWLYTGILGNESDYLATYQWAGNNTLQVNSKIGLYKREGITVSVSFPKGIIAPYQPTFFEKYGKYVWVLMPIIVFIICLSIWNKYGKDPKVGRSIAPEFSPPANLTPLEMGALMHYGNISNNLISATIISLATKGFLKITEIDKKWYQGGDDFELSITNSSVKLTELEELLVHNIFEGEDKALLSSLKNKFYKKLPALKQRIKSELKAKKLLPSKIELGAFMIFALCMILPIFGVIAAKITESVIPFFMLILLFGIAFIFLIFMPKRTPKGAELVHQIKGFKLYMETAEKYRQQFYEKENMFEKFLPYAMVFGITKLWAKKMAAMYAVENRNLVYAPLWYIGANPAQAFNLDSFTSKLNSISSSIASSTSAPGGGGSGFGGGGGAGGGGGGGGGGGW